jgi:Alpha-glutamyl/putrescinyl thymine pyrophosphorylase clade 3
MNALYRSNKISQLEERLTTYEGQCGVLPGIEDASCRNTLLRQMVDSVRRIEYIHHVRESDHDERRIVPGSGLFDPLKAAAIHSRRGDLDEAYWLVFLATHFGKHAEDGWRLAEDVYGKLGQGGTWNWVAVVSSLPEFRQWLIANEATLRGGDGVRRRFSNHRKYESLSAASQKGLAEVIESYVAWVNPPRTHDQLVRELHRLHGQNPQTIFGVLYKSMNAVSRFGRLGKFDYLTMLAKLGICPISPDSAYLREATGPMTGARLLFLGDSTDSRADKQLDSRLVELDGVLDVGMQVLEDSLCNWQKSPAKHIYFRG